MQKRFEQVLMPVATKIGNNVVLRSLRDGFLIITPLIIVTSMFLLFGNFPIPGWADFWTGVLGKQWTDWFSAVCPILFSVLPAYYPVLGFLMRMVIIVAYMRSTPLRSPLFLS